MRFSQAKSLFLALLIPGTGAVQAQVRPGIDALAASNYAALRGKRVGLVTNQTGVNAAGEKTRLLLRRAPGVQLVALFAPEHGLDGVELAGKYVANKRDAATGLTVFSLYGPTRKPTPEMLRGIDALVYDMQDIGVRSYTYLSTMGRCMEAAGEAGIEFVVLDRPNPLGGTRVEGPGLEERWVSFVGQFPVPYVHGLTAGEMARMANERGWMAARCDLKVIPAQGWRRGMTWEDTGLPWVRTSPNIPRATSPLYYIATGIVGSLSGVDTGVGGPKPFEYLSAPWLDGAGLARRLASGNFVGVGVQPLSKGVSLQIHPDAPGNITGLALYLLAEANRTASPDLFARSSKDKLDIFYKVYGSDSIRRELASGTNPARIVASWEAGVERFRRTREPYLLYPQ